MAWGARERGLWDLGVGSVANGMGGLGRSRASGRREGSGEVCGVWEGIGSVGEGLEGVCGIWEKGGEGDGGEGAGDIQEEVK